MQLNIFLFAILIILSFSLKETLPIYKAMTELKPALQKEACLFKKDNEELYMQPCQEGFHCGNKQKDISTCIPNYFGQKVGEACNYDDECIYGECDEKSKKCIYKEGIYDELSYSYRCAGGLVYDYQNDKCVENNFLKDYCTYTKKGEKEISIEPNMPFYVCGEAGYATEKDQPELQPNTRYVKITKIGTLELGATTGVEYACKSGAVSKIEENDFWMCDKIKSSKLGVDGNTKYIEYNFEKAGVRKYTEDDYEGAYFFYNKLTGENEAYEKVYDEIWEKYLKAMKKYEKKCIANSHDYYFRPLDCGIKEIAEAAFYLDKTYFYTNKTKEAKMVRDYCLGEDFTTRTVSSELLSFKKSLIILFAIFALL